MGRFCGNCGHQVDGKSPICMYCGAPIDDEDILQETKDRIKEETVKQSVKQTTKNIGTSAKAIGAALIIIGILADIGSMFLIFSDGYEAFNVLTIGGTISFLIGLALISNS